MLFINYILAQLMNIKLYNREPEVNTENQVSRRQAVHLLS